MTMKHSVNKTHLFLLPVIFTVNLFTSSLGIAGDANAGKAKSAACAGCHGMQGISNAPNYPNLAGQKEKYLVSAINSYRTGGRNDPTMKAMVASLNDEDVVNLAAYFSSLASK